jgi:hypothetical protein
MTALIEERPPDVSAEQRAADEIVKLVRKLRWMGMESEAKQVAMVACRLPSADSVLPAPALDA